MSEENALSEGNVIQVTNPELWDRIHAIDLSMVKMKLMLEHNDSKKWTNVAINHVETRYRRFLYMIGTNKGMKMVPTKDIDDFWHQHILDTRAYQRDCEAAFGQFIHHYPYFGLASEAESDKRDQCFRTTASIYFSLFGEPYNGISVDCSARGCDGGVPACDGVVPANQ